MICLQKYCFFCSFAMFFNSNKMDKALKTIAALILMMAFAMGCSKPDEPTNNDNPTDQNDSIVSDSIVNDSIINDSVVYDHGFVDLGLPSGLLWATCNIGASSTEDCGDYFAWGETAKKGMYDWKQYKYSSVCDDGCYLTKYCTDPKLGFNGFVDSLMVLEPIDDAVIANWGADWRMPTKEEYEELNQETTFTWTKVNGVEGRLLTGPNGNSIFFPATGFYLDGEVICTGLGIYWSSSLQTVSQVSAWSLHFDYENCHVCATYERSRGHCVRAVRVY